MKIRLTSIRNEPGEGFFERQLKALSECASERKHSLVDSFEEADVIFIADHDGDPDFRLLRDSDWVRKFPHKCFLFSENAAPIWLLPGLYTSPGRSLFAGNRIRSVPYLSQQTFIKNPFVSEVAIGVPKDLFLSFAGGSTSLVRKRLFKLSPGRSDVLLENTSTYHHWNLRQEGRAARQKRYVDIARRSRFSLCPRGCGTGSIRLFEMLEMGVAPVILSDSWRPPAGPDWSEFSVFIPENKVHQVVEIMEPYEDRWQRMGEKARKTWETWFAMDRQFNYLMGEIEAIRKTRQIDERLIRLLWPYLISRQKLRRGLRLRARNAVLRVFEALRIKFPYELNRPGS